MGKVFPARKKLSAGKIAEKKRRTAAKHIRQPFLYRRNPRDDWKSALRAHFSS